MKATAELTVRQIPIEEIVPSATNPRKSIDTKQLEELAQSIKSVGIQVPLALRTVVRGPGAVEFELVGGERRWRAAQIAGLETVPAIVREMTDAEAREMQLVENLQRADLSPMEEAEGYEQLIDKAASEGLVIPDGQLALKVGKPLGYVRSRRKLLDLIPDARAALAEQFITFGCALLIAKLLPAEQERAAARALNWNAKTLSDALERLRQEKADNDKYRSEALASGEDTSDYDEPLNSPMSEAHLKEWIAENILLDLARAPWPLDADNLHPEAGACTTCPKRSGSDLALFAELTAKADVCTDPACFAVKRSTFIHIATEAAKVSGKPLLKLSMQYALTAAKPDAKSYKKGQWLEAKPSSCPHVRQGITEEGQILSVCVEPKCKVHKHVAAAELAIVPGQKQESWEVRDQREKAERATALAKELPVRRAVYAAMRPKLKGAKLLRAAIDHLLRHANTWGMSEFLGLCKPDSKQRAQEVWDTFARAKDSELEGWLFDLAFANAANPNEYRPKERKDFFALAKSMGVDANAIAARIEAEQKKTVVAAAPEKKKISAERPKAAAKSKAAKKAVKKVAKKKAAKKDGGR